MKKKMTLEEKYKDVPHFEIIKKDGYIEIPSIFMFQEGQSEYYPFLQACKEYNCTVRLVNEDITIKPDDEDMIRKVKEMLYFQMMQSPEIVENYIRYLLYKSSVSWDNVK